MRPVIPCHQLGGLASKKAKLGSSIGNEKEVQPSTVERNRETSCYEESLGKGKAAK